MRTSPLIAQWPVSHGVDSYLTLNWFKWHHYHVCMANGLPGATEWRRVGGTCVRRVSLRWEHTWARRRAQSTPKSILTPLKRLSASVALQRNYPFGNDISTQFLPACLLAESLSCRPVDGDVVGPLSSWYPILSGPWDLDTAGRSLGRWSCFYLIGRRCAFSRPSDRLEVMELSKLSR